MTEPSHPLMRSGLTLALSSGLLALLAGCSAPASRQPARVRAEALHSEAFVRSLDTVSTLEATDEIELASQAGGRVQQVLVQGGDPVKAGQMLVVQIGRAHV